eukprot:6175579-Pleurochrysis_carterae.AAC.1
MTGYRTLRFAQDLLSDSTHGTNCCARVCWLAGGLRVLSEAGRREGLRAAAGRGRRTVACVRR